MEPKSPRHGWDPREQTRAQYQQKKLDTQTNDVSGYSHTTDPLQGTTRTIPHQVPIYDAVTMQPMYRHQNTPNQPLRIPMKPTNLPVDFSKAPIMGMGVDTQIIVDSSHESRVDTDCPKYTRRSRPSSVQRNRKNKGKYKGEATRWRSVERDTFIRDGQQFTDHHIARPSSQGTGNLKPQVDPQPFVKKWNELSLPTTDEVFKFMVKDMSGSGTPLDIKRQSKLFPEDADIIDWLRKNENRFTLIERGDTITNVLVFNKHVKCCLDYYKVNSCAKSNCHRYHVCKNLLSGKCIYGRKNCKFSHDCFDDHNEKISAELGYSNLYTNDEVCSILRASFPHVCTTWANHGNCDELNCFGLHICPKYILAKCNNGPNCPQVHDRKTDHNKPIFDAFEMSDMQYNMFRWRIFLNYNPATKRNESRATDGIASKVQPTGKSIVASKSSVQEETEASRETYICSRYLVGECRDMRCKFVHSSNNLPYIWQIKLFGTWISVIESENIEEAFANHAARSDRICMTHDGIAIVLLMLFEPTIRARVLTQFDDRPTDIEARRLSTMSYCQVKERDEDTNDFSTQWRWYWQDDLNQWILFEPEAFQYTMEAKCLAEQKTYIFARENFFFNYTISFKEMLQTNNETGKSRCIRRRPLYVTSEDVKRRSFPSSLSADHTIATPLPDSWMPWDCVHPFELVDITDNDCHELREVTKLFFNTLDSRKVKIDTISRLQNHKLWGLFCSQERTMETNARRVGRGSTLSVEKRYLFHGTDGIDAVRGISINNFDVRVSGKTGTLYGDGAYFARDSKYSHAYTKGSERYMFVVNVLVGEYTKGHKSYRRPPNKPGSDHELFDSCVDDTINPAIFVVFDKNQYYPEYLIKYHDAEQALKCISTGSGSIKSTSARASIQSSVAVTRQSTDQFGDLHHQQKMLQAYQSSNYLISTTSRCPASDSLSAGQSVIALAPYKNSIHDIKSLTAANDQRQTEAMKKFRIRELGQPENLKYGKQSDTSREQPIVYSPVSIEFGQDLSSKSEFKEKSLIDLSCKRHTMAKLDTGQSSKKSLGKYPKTPPRSRRHVNLTDD